MRHEFTEQIIKIIEEFYSSQAQYIFDKSEVLQYLNIKTKSANRGSKSRGGFANHYAIYVLVEDYLK